MRVHRLSFTPVKATQLHLPDEITLTREGFAGDRSFCFIDPATARYDSHKLGALMPLVADHDVGSECLRFTLPSGDVIEGSAVAPADAEAVEVIMWGRLIPAKRVPGPWDELASELTGLRLRLVRPDRGNFTDEEPLTLMSLASASELSAALGGADPGTRRFRMGIDLDGGSAREEDTWVGRKVWVGEAVIEVLGPVPRCVVTTWDPATGIKELDTLKAISQVRGRGAEGLPMGVYAKVIEPGKIAVGDLAQPLDF